jgi:hypothetical protein
MKKHPKGVLFWFNDNIFKIAKNTINSFALMRHNNIRAFEICLSCLVD